MKDYDEVKIKEITKELFSVCYDKGIYLMLSANAGMVTCTIGNICYFSYLGKLVFNSRSILKDEVQTLPIWELLEIVKQYNNEK